MDFPTYNAERELRAAAKRRAADEIETARNLLGALIIRGARKTDVDVQVDTSAAKLASLFIYLDGNRYRLDIRPE